MLKIRLAIFASGTGTNALNIIDHFVGHPTIEIAFVLTNRADAPVIGGCKKRSIGVFIFNNEQVAKEEILLDICAKNKIDYIILAGYLRLIPKGFISHYPERIINVHPAILPNYGGKGMYGSKVHEAVIAAKEKQTGISFHFVNEHFDEGRLISQYYCPVSVSETVESLSKKVHKLEHTYFPSVIENTILLSTHE